MKTSTILTLAKRYLNRADGTTEAGLNVMATSYICNAISIATDKWGADTNKYATQRDMLHQLIETRLEGTYSLEGWLQRMHGINVKSSLHDGEEEAYAYCSKCQATRHAWIDSLIVEFRIKGD